MKSDDTIWIYTQHARCVGGHYEIPGSRGDRHVDIILDRDLTLLISDDDPRADLRAKQRLLQDAAKRLFDEGCVTKIERSKSPGWQVVITRADLEAQLERQQI